MTTGPTTTTTLDMDGADGNLLRASGTVRIQLFSFVTIAGEFAFEKKENTLTSEDGESSEDFDILTIGSSNAYVFAGIGGPYWVFEGEDIVAQDDGAIGIAVGGITAGLALLTNKEQTNITYIGLQAHIDDASLLGLADLLTIEAHDIDIQLNTARDRDDADATPDVFDFNRFEGGGLSVLTGGDDVVISHDLELLKVTAADATISIGSFLYVRGGFAYERSPEVSEVLPDDSTRTLDVIKVGASNAYAFAGLGGPYWTDSNEDGVLTSDDEPVADGAVGIALGGVTFGLALLKQTGVADPATYIAFKATADSATLVGFEDFLELSANNITIDVNQADDPSGEVVAGDFSSLDGGGLSISTGGDEVLIDYSDVLLRVTSTDALFRVSEFIFLRGGFAFEKDTSLVEDLGDGEVRNLDVVKFGVSGAHVFAGVGGPYWTDSDDNGVIDGDDEPITDGAVGIAIGNVNAALVMLQQTGVTDPVRYVALKLHADSAALVGFEDVLVLEGTDITVEWNYAVDPEGVIRAADFTGLDGGGLEVLTGGDTILVDFADQLLRVVIGQGELQLADFIYLSGTFALESKPQSVTLADGSEVETMMLTIGGTNIDGFAGVNGPADADGAVGFAFTGLEFALGLFTPDADQEAIADLRWTTLKATADSFTLVGLPGIGVEATELSLAVNRVSGVADGDDADLRVIDYSAEALEVLVGPSATVDFDFAGEFGQLLEVAGTINLTIGNFFYVAGSLAFRSASETLTLADGEEVETRVLTLGGTDLDAFAGLNGPGD
ncbi:MAG: hypothetical protein C0503_10015, partial [Gemmatimonas sp.]|nr:hypothetical protein [Gemmatimonas sp.]